MSVKDRSQGFVQNSPPDREDTSHKSEKERTRARIRRISKNFFFHIHAPRVHIHSLKPNYTYGLGLMLALLFLILLVTGVLLMLYYTPSVESLFFSERYRLRREGRSVHKEPSSLGRACYGSPCLYAPFADILHWSLLQTS